MRAFLLELRDTRSKARHLVEQTIEGAGDRIRDVAADRVRLKFGFGFCRGVAAAHRARRDANHCGAFRHLREDYGLRADTRSITHTEWSEDLS